MPRTRPSGSTTAVLSNFLAAQLMNREGTVAACPGLSGRAFEGLVEGLRFLPAERAEVVRLNPAVVIPLRHPHRHGAVDGGYGPLSHPVLPAIDNQRLAGHEEGVGILGGV